MLDLTQFYGAIKISGDDKDNFLQGQITCNINKITLNKAAFAAHCNQKGRMISLFFIIRWGNVVYLIMPKAIIDKTLKTLQRYVFISKVVLEPVDSLQIIGYIDTIPDILEKPKDEFAVSQNTHACMVHIPGQRLMLISEKPHHNPNHINKSIQAWHLLDIQNNMPWLTPETIGTLIPNDINLQAHGGVSFEKGCYIGQEIIARMHYLGKSKKRLCLVHIKSDTSPTPGVAIMASQDQSAGELMCYVRQVDHILGLAVLKQAFAQQSLELVLSRGKLTIQT